MTHPQLVSKRLSPTCREAIPKSAILMLFFSSNSRFSGFRSLWLNKRRKGFTWETRTHGDVGWLQAISVNWLDQIQTVIKCRFNYRLHLSDVILLPVNCTFLNIRLVKRLVWMYMMSNLYNCRLLQVFLYCVFSFFAHSLTSDLNSKDRGS